MRGPGAAALVVAATVLCSAPSVEAAEPPQVRMKLIATDVPVCDRPIVYEGNVETSLLWWLRPLLDPPHTHVLRTRMLNRTGGFAADLTLRRLDGRVLKTRHLETIGVCGFEALYLAGKAAAQMIEEEVPPNETPKCKKCEECPRTNDSSAKPAAPTKSTVARSSAARSPLHTQIDLEVGPDLPHGCFRPDELTRLVYEIVYKEKLGAPTKNVVNVYLERSRSGGIDLHVAHYDEQGNALHASHNRYGDVCCFEVLYLAAVEAAVMIGGEWNESEETCPECAPCPETPPPPPTLPPPRPLLRPTPTRTPGGRPRIFVNGGAFYGPGIAPEPALGVKGGVGLRLASWFSVEVEARLTFPILPAVATQTVSTGWSFAGSGASCVWLDKRYGFCGVVTVGGLWSTTAPEYRVARAPGFASAGLRGVVELPLPWEHYAFRVEGEFAGAFWTPVHRSPRDAPITGDRRAMGHFGLLVVKSF